MTKYEQVKSKDTRLLSVIQLGPAESAKCSDGELETTRLVVSTTGRLVLEKLSTPRLSANLAATQGYSSQVVHCIKPYPDHRWKPVL